MCVKEIAEVWDCALESVCDGTRNHVVLRVKMRLEEANFFFNFSSPPGGCLGGAPTQSDFFFYFYLAP